jgi:hypothetical protein
LPKKKDRSEVEYFRGKLREAQKEINSLRKQVKALSKKEHIFDDAIEDYQELLSQQESAEIAKTTSCLKCNVGQMVLAINMDKKDIYECNSCAHRKVVNK